VASPFDVLGVDPDADEAEVDRAYRRRVIETHPDQGGSIREFQVVKDAYEEIKEREFDGAPAQITSGSESGGATGATGSSGSGGPGGPTGAASDPGDESTGSAGLIGSRVEYLNYEVLDDHGWMITDDDLFEKAADAGLDRVDHGEVVVQPSESLLEAAEGEGFTWPFACRGGACANCAIAVIEGELAMPGDQILSEELIDEGIRLSCIGTPVTADMKVVFNVKHLPSLEELRLPPGPFERAHSGD
jgi:ferredoxin